MKQQTQLSDIVSFCFFFVAVAVVFLGLVGVSFISESVLGVNQTNVTTRVNVTNTQPFFLSVNITPETIALTPGGVTNVTCSGRVFDYNGFQDFSYGNATIFFNATGFDAANDNNNHYFVDNSSCATAQVNATVYTVNCTAQVQYYANNGTWVCQMNVIDDGGSSNPVNRLNASAYSNDSATVQALLALNTSSELDYGNLTVLQTSNDVEFNITNYGNLPINISVRAFANNTDQRNLSMECDFNDILVEQQRYSLTSGVSFASMTPVTNSSTQIADFSLPQRVNDTNFGFDRNATFWKLQIPLSVGGDCEGTLQFTASLSTN